jgi:hypothetical protein
MAYMQVDAGMIKICCLVYGVIICEFGFVFLMGTIAKG